MVTRYVLQRLETPPTAAHSIAHEKDALNQVTIRGRLKGKTTMRKAVQTVDEEGEETPGHQKSRILKVLEEEMMHLVNDEPEIAIAGVQALAKLKNGCIRI